MITNNIGQIAYLTAMHYGLKQIFFGGFFIRGNPFTMAKMSFAINFWSKGTMKVRNKKITIETDKRTKNKQNVFCLGTFSHT
jgi:pantothenate kinase